MSDSGVSSQAVFDAWRKVTLIKSMTRGYEQWSDVTEAKEKRMRVRARKMSRPVEDVKATADRYFARLLEDPNLDWSALNGAWLSCYGVCKILMAEALLHHIPTKATLAPYAVYRAAIQMNVDPAGIVCTSDCKVDFKHPVAGERVYVGVALPFLSQLGFPFCRKASDRVFVSNE